MCDLLSKKKNFISFDERNTFLTRYIILQKVKKRMINESSFRKKYFIEKKKKKKVLKKKKLSHCLQFRIFSTKLFFSVSKFWVIAAARRKVFSFFYFCNKFYFWQYLLYRLFKTRILFNLIKTFSTLNLNYNHNNYYWGHFLLGIIEYAKRWGKSWVGFYCWFPESNYLYMKRSLQISSFGIDIKTETSFLVTPIGNFVGCGLRNFEECFIFVFFVFFVRINQSNIFQLFFTYTLTDMSFLKWNLSNLFGFEIYF